ncbi:hypothetical protein GS676_02645 [Rhodococcus hoagii]|nr:hypothetical protein [Prescottella equi]
MRSGDHFMTHNGIEYASVKGAAQSAGVVERTVRDWIASGRLTAVRLPGRRLWMRVDEVHAAKKASMSAPGGRGKAFTDRELQVVLDRSFTDREASILTGRSVPAIRKARQNHGGAA